MEIFKLFGSVLIDNDKANESIDNTGKKAEGLGSKLGSVIGTAAKVGAGIVAGAGVAGAAMFGLASKSAEAADYIDKLSERTGINREELQRWKYAAGQSGADIGKLETGVKKLSDVMDGALNGNKANAQAFRDLGISLTDASGKARSSEDVFSDVMNKLGDMEQGAARNALGNDLLGKSYTEMLPLLNAGSEGMDALKSRADELGLVMSEEAVKANVVFGDTLADVKSSLGAVGMQIGTAVLPIMQTMLDWFLGHMPTIQKVTKRAFEIINDVIMRVVNWIKDHVIPILDSLWSNAESNLPVIQQIFEKVFGIIVDVAKNVYRFFMDNLLPIFLNLFEWVQGHMPTIRETFVNVLNKVVEMATKVWSFFKDKILPIISNFYQMIQEKMPQIQSIVEKVFGIISDVVKIVWDLFENFLLPVLKGLWDFIEPTFPLIGSIVEAAFDTVVAIVETTIEVFDKVTGAIKTAVDWLTSWNDKPAKKKKVEVEEVRSNSITGDIPQYSTGTNYHPGGLALVGERGAELLNLPRGTKVSTANQTREMLNGTIQYNNYITVEGNIDKDLYDEITSRQMNEYDNKLRVLGVKG